jgi:signal transduction histidine kinase
MSVLVGMKLWRRAPVIVVGLVAALHAGGQEVQIQPAMRTAGYGSSVAFVGPYLVIGESGTGLAGKGVGAVHVLRHTDSGVWSGAAVLRPEPALSGTSFGTATVMAAGSLIVGEPQYPSPLRFSGRLQIVPFAGGAASGVAASLQVTNPSLAQVFGSALAVRGNVLLVGAPGASTPAGQTGEAVLFEAQRGTWIEREHLVGAGSDGGAAFGAAVAMSDAWLAVAAPQQGDGVGAVYVFRRGSKCCAEAARLEPNGSPERALYGASIAMAGNFLAIGAPGGRAGAFAGFVEIWRLNESGPERVGLIEPQTPFPDGRFGAAVALDAEMIAVGAPGEDSMGPDSGSVHVVRLQPGGVPGQTRRLSIPTIDGGDSFGAAVSLRAGRLAVGAPGTGGGDGAVYLYDTADVFAADHMEFELLAHPREGMIDPRVNAIVEDDRGMLLFGTLGGGLEVFDGTRFLTAADGAERLTTLTALRDQQGVVWFGTEQGLYRLDRAGSRYLRATLRSDALGDEPVVALFEDRDGQLWAGTGGRLFRKTLADAEFVEYAPFYGPPTANNEEYISGIQQDSTGTLWILAKNLSENRASLYSVDVDSARIERRPLAPEWQQVGPLLVDSQDRLWIKAPTPVILPLPDGPLAAPPDVIDEQHWAITETRAGDIWIGTETGPYRRGRGTESMELLRIAPWAAPQRPWDFSRSFYETSDGAVLVGTNGGIYRARDAGSATRRAAGQLMITRAVITGATGQRSGVPTPGDTLALTSDDYRLEFGFALIDYRRGGAPSYRYRLDGFDRDWVPATGGTALYTDLPPGDFTFRVEAVGRPTGRSVPALAMRVSIQPPYWQTWWFRGLLGVTAVAAMFATARYRRAQRAELESLRLRIARDLHDDLSTNLSGIALLAERTVTQLEPGQKPAASVQTIHGTARDMLEDLRDLVWLVDPEHDSAEGLLLKMRTVAESLLGERFTMRAEGVPALHHLRMADRRELLFIYKELVHNAARHAAASNVTIALDAGPDSLRLSVVDDGVGFDPDGAIEGSGIASLHERARRLGGVLRIDSAPGSGTRAVFTRS